MLSKVKLIGTIEAISMLLLVFVAMPLKYAAGVPQLVTYIGAVHGVLWLVYVAVLAYAWYALKWSFFTLVAGVICSIVPFGPFFFDAKFLKAS